MRNADRPAMPYTGVKDQWITDQEARDGVRISPPPSFPGLTKREAFAMAAAQGMCSRSGSYHTPQDLAHDAVKVADALLAALETKEQSK